MNFTLLELVLATLAGGGVGFLSGVFGIGGSFLLIPVLNIGLGIPMSIAVGSGACQVLGPATTSVLARRVKFHQLRLPLTISGGLLIGVFVGAHLLQLTKQYEDFSVAGRNIPLSDFVVLIAYFLLLTGLGCFTIWETYREKQHRNIKRGYAADWSLPPCSEFPDLGRQSLSIPLLCWFGLAVGFLAGLLGMSGGLVLLPALIYLLGLRTHKAILNTVVIVWIVAFQATIVHAWHGNINLMLVMSLLLGGTIGARIGSETSQKMGGGQLRSGFGWLLLATAVLIAAKIAWFLVR